MTNTKLHKGSCHCGAIQFEATLDASKGNRCNCSICTKIAQFTTIIAPAAFKLLQGAESATGYQWGWKNGTRYFCKTCGVQVYGTGDLPQLGGAYVSVSLNALDDIDPNESTPAYFDGRHDNWQAGTRDAPWPMS